MKSLQRQGIRVLAGLMERTKCCGDGWAPQVQEWWEQEHWVPSQKTCCSSPLPHQTGGDHPDQFHPGLWNNWALQITWPLKALNNFMQVRLQKRNVTLLDTTRERVQSNYYKEKKTLFSHQFILATYTAWSLCVCSRQEDSFKPPNMRSLEQLQTGEAWEPLVRQFIMTGEARQRVAEDDPIKTLQYHMKDVI